MLELKALGDVVEKKEPVDRRAEEEIDEEVWLLVAAERHREESSLKEVDMV